MKNFQSSTIINLLTDAGKSGLHCQELRRLSNMDEEMFEEEAMHLWEQGRITGIREDRCCGRGCAFMCVSYMEEDRVWRLKVES